MSFTVIPIDKTKENKPPKAMSKFAAYLKEREGVDLFENEYGFAVYSLGKAECYIRDIFVYPEHRRARHCYDIANEISRIAKEAGCTLLTGTVATHANGSTDNIQVLIGYGMRIHSTGTHGISFVKDL